MKKLLSILSVIISCCVFGQCPPNLSYTVTTQTLTCNNPTILATGSSTTANTVISWSAPSIPSPYIQPTLAIGPPNGPATSTFALGYGVYTVVATNTMMACQSTQTILITQNFRKPTPQISPTSSNTSVCNNKPVTLGPGSSTVTSGVPGAMVNIVSWNGPPPLTAGTNYTYLATVAGTYTLVISDSYNGCTSTVTSLVPSGAPNFSLSSTAPSTSVSCDGIVVISNGPASNYSVSTTNGSLTGTPQKTITNVCTGKIVVCMTYTNFNAGCTTCDSLNISIASGLRDQSIDDVFTIYPNPSQSTVHIKNLTATAGELKLFNLEGKEVNSQLIERGIDNKLENLGQGMYFIEISLGSEIYRKKIIVLK